MRLRTTWEGTDALRLVTLGLVVAVAYYAGARLGFLLVFPGSPLSILWPPNAIVLAALLLVPPRNWWIVLLGVLPAHLVVEWQSGVTPLAVPGLYVTNCGEALLGATLVRRYSGGEPPWLGTWRQVIVYVVGAAVAAPFVASFLDTSVVVAARWAPQGYWLLWEERFISAVLTNLTVAPVILLLASGAWQRGRGWRPWQTLSRRRGVEVALLALSILGSGYVAFSLPMALPQNTPELLYVLAPVLLWAAMRFGVGGISASLLTLAILAAGWANASGLFVARTPAVAVVTLQLFLIALGAPALCLAALVQERERDAETLRASEARYRATFASAAIGVAVVDLTGRPLDVNAYVSQMLGYTADELRTMALRDLTHPDDVADTETLLGSARSGQIGDYQLEKRYRHKDGHTVWGRVSASLVRDQDGQSAYFVVHLEDITPHKQLEQERAVAHAEAEARAEELDRIFETMADGVIVYDADGKTARTNAAARTLLSLQAAPTNYYALPGAARMALFQTYTLAGRLLAPDELASSRALRGERLTGASALEITSRAFDGRELALSVSAAPLRNADGRIVGAVAILHDQTERNRLMQEREEARANELALREVNARLDTFAAVAAHDLRSPVGVTRLAVHRAQSLLQQLSAPQARAPQTAREEHTRVLAQVWQAVELTQQSLDRQWRLMQQLLDVTQARQGTLTLLRQPVRVAELVRATVDDQRLLNPNRVIELTEPDADLASLTLDADPDRLSQVLTNYLANAVRYSPEDQPIIVTMQMLDQALHQALDPGLDQGLDQVTAGSCGRAVRVVVRDHGTGIAPEEQAGVWERFQRARSLREARGLGLGLYIARTIIELHGGQVGVDSAVGAGSSFWFSLPASPVPPALPPRRASRRRARS